MIKLYSVQITASDSENAEKTELVYTGNFASCKIVKIALNKRIKSQLKKGLIPKSAKWRIDIKEIILEERED